MDYVTPAGFRDVLSDEACMRERIARDVQACFAARGYLPIETPTLEVMDVMRAGGRMPGSPFKFFDASGDLLAMRPDVTLQVARMCATRLAGQPGPFRFRYMQRVFREAEGRMQAQAREMTQIDRGRKPRSPAVEHHQSHGRPVGQPQGARRQGRRAEEARSGEETRAQAGVGLEARDGRGLFGNAFSLTTIRARSSPRAKPNRCRPRCR